MAAVTRPRHENHPVEENNFIFLQATNSNCGQTSFTGFLRSRNEFNRNKILIRIWILIGRYMMSFFPFFKFVLDIDWIYQDWQDVWVAGVCSTPWSEEATEGTFIMMFVGLIHCRNWVWSKSADQPRHAIHIYQVNSRMELVAMDFAWPILKLITCNKLSLVITNRYKILRTSVCPTKIT